MFTYVNLFSWGVQLEGQISQGCWTLMEAKKVKWLEFRTIFLALKAFQTSLRDKDMLVYATSTARETWSRSLQTLSLQLFLWTENDLV